MTKIASMTPPIPRGKISATLTANLITHPEDDRGEAGLRSDPIHSRPQVGGVGGNWNTTGDSGRFTKDDGGTALSQTPSASMARLSDTVSHGRERGPLMSYLRDAVVGNAEEDHP